MVPFFWTLVLGFGAGSERTIAGLRRHDQGLTGHIVVASAFYDRFTKSLVEFLRLALAHALTVATTSIPGRSGIFAGFVDVLALDATIVRLHPLLGKKFPSCWTNQTKASAKLDVVMCVKDSSLRSVKITEGRRHECRNKKVGPWISGRLLLFDLGYYKYSLFDRIDAHKGFFVSRLKANANPVITKELRRWRGYRGRRSAARRTFRLVGIKNEETGEHHLYLTNIPSSSLDASEIAKAYQARWQVELLFCELKTHYRLDNVKIRKMHVVEALLYAALLTLMASRRLHQAVRAKLGKGSRAPALRWASLLAGVSQVLLQIVAGRCRAARALATLLEPLLIAEAEDPNRNRRLLLDRVESLPIAA